MLRRMRRRFASRLAPFAVVVLLAAVLAPLGACATFEQDLQRSEEHFQHDEHEKALANLRSLEYDWTAFSPRDQARYCYLRGMTDVRLGFMSDARHWLAVAQEIDKDHPGSLLDKERRATDQKLATLNEVIWAGDVLPIDEPPGDRRSKKVQTTSSDDKSEAKTDAKGDESGDADEAKPKKKKGAATDDAAEADAPKPKAKKKSADPDADAPAPKKKKPATDE
jgi:hypothetical protein